MAALPIACGVGPIARATEGRAAALMCFPQHLHEDVMRFFGWHGRATLDHCSTHKPRKDVTRQPTAVPPTLHRRLPAHRLNLHGIPRSDKVL